MGRGIETLGWLTRWLIKKATCILHSHIYKNKCRHAQVKRWDERNSWGEVGGNTYDGYFEILVIIIKIIFFLYI